MRTIHEAAERLHLADTFASIEEASVAIRNYIFVNDIAVRGNVSDTIYVSDNDYADIVAELKG